MAETYQRQRAGPSLGQRRMIYVTVRGAAAGGQQPQTAGGYWPQWIRRLNYDPEFFRPRPIDSEVQWLTQRVATTHDIHHVVTGFGTMPAGESGVLAITAGQLVSFRFQL